jgi:multidrug transporter EmrE-like cation transporter
VELDRQSLAGSPDVSVGSLVGTVPILVVAGLPEREAWWYVAGSSCVHTAYVLCLAGAYERTDFTLLYTVARGLAPAIAGVVWLDDDLSLLGGVGILLVSIGIGSLVRLKSGELAGLRWALATAVCIATYTVLDGAGTGAGDESLRYLSAVLFLSTMLIIGVVVVRRRWDAVVNEVRTGLMPRLAAHRSVSCRAREKRQ